MENVPKFQLTKKTQNPDFFQQQSDQANAGESLGKLKEKNLELGLRLRLGATTTTTPIFVLCI